MGYPELDRDESIILEAKNVKFKSISFDARLTSRRIILIDSRKNIIPPQEILLATMWKVEAGENAIRDHLLTLIVVNNAGEKDQIVLTFPRLAGAERKRECNDWARKLQALIHPTPAEPERAIREGPGQEPEKHKPERDTAHRHPVKKKIEIARPLSKITEPARHHVPPAAPVETSSLPSGVFCSRCGNRVPMESTFCNHCGTPVRQQAEPAPARPAEVPQVQVPAPLQPQIPLPPPAGSPAEHQDRPIEQIIHSIEPLIEDSVPRSQPTPLVKKRAPQIVSEPVQPESPPAPVVPESPAETPPAVVWPV
ncbi:MAG TPA: zinc-ribbon domain-containing protein, partial [Methanoregula sp.]|nr:zinc-ribbon domain-containing protein [Methanoregula sp.]